MTVFCLKKTHLASLLYRTGALTLLARRQLGRLIVFNYHRLWQNRCSTIFDTGVYNSSVAEFKTRLQWLKQNSDLLTEADLLALLKNGGTLPRLATMITFDDAYADFYTLAYPVLRELCVPSILFVPTHAIDTRQLYWWDIVAYLIRQTKEPVLRLTDATFQLPAQCHDAILFYQGKIKLSSPNDALHLMEQLATFCRVPLPSAAMQSNELMTWEQIREVANHGVSIGSHSHRHHLLSSLDLTAQQEELMTPVTILERHLGHRPRSLAYPFGNYIHFSPDTKQLAAACGYDLAFSFETGVNESGFDRYDIRRISPPSELSMLLGMTVYPRFFAPRGKKPYQNQS